MFWPKAKLCKCSGMSARCHCLREILKFLWCETTEIYCSKAAKNKQKPTSVFLPALIQLLWRLVIISIFMENPLNFFKYFHCMESGAWERTRVPFSLEEKTRDMVRLGALFLSQVPWLTQRWYNTLSLVLWSCIMTRASFQGALLPERLIPPKIGMYVWKAFFILGL